MCDYVKKPCKKCPFRSDVKPYLHPDRAAGDFSRAKTCAGFLTLRAQSGERMPDGFEPSWEICYTDDYDMIQAYDDKWNAQHKTASDGA